MNGLNSFSVSSRIKVPGFSLWFSWIFGQIFFNIVKLNCKKMTFQPGLRTQSGGRNPYLTVVLVQPNVYWQKATGQQDAEQSSIQTVPANSKFEKNRNITVFLF